MAAHGTNFLNGCRMRWLMGEQTEARQMLQQVRLDYLRHRDGLRRLGGELALRDGIEAAERMME